MITSLHLRNFKGHRDTTIPLGRFTVLVGPNGAGKTSVLQALQLLGKMSVQAPRLCFEDELSIPDIVHRASPTGPIELAVDGISEAAPWKASFELVWQEPKTPVGANQLPWLPIMGWSYGEESGHQKSFDTPFQASAPPRLWGALRATVLYRFDARRIAAASFNAEQVPWVGEDGEDTAAVLATLKLEREEDFARIQEKLRRIVPNVERIRFGRVTHRGTGSRQAGHKIHLDFRGAPDVPAHSASEGTLVTLALLTVICGPTHPNLILLDDIDQSLHPAAQIAQVQEIKRILDEMPDLQIVATTHSPYIVDELEPEDVIVCALRADGSVAAKRLSEHPQAAKMKGMLSAGQIWTLDPEREWVVEETAS